MDELIAKVKKDIHGVNFCSSSGEIHIYNPSDESWNILHIGYFNAKGDYRDMFVFSNAYVYIMQNGKTVDKIYV